LLACDSATNIGDTDGSIDIDGTSNGESVSGENTSDNTAANTDGSTTGIVDAEIADAEIDFVGLLKLEATSTETDFSRALFGQLDSSLTAAEIEQWYAPSSDVCVVTAVNDESNSAVPSFFIEDQQPRLISAGDNVILTSDAGTYATLSKEPGDAPFYRTDVELIGDAPANLTLDIPGDEFPSFSGIEIGEVPEFQITSPLAGDDVTADTDFTWNANNVPGSVIEVYAGGTGANNQQVEIGCSLVDDGSFNFPAAVRAELGDNFIADWSAYLRITYRVAQSENAIVFTANSVESR